MTDKQYSDALQYIDEAGLRSHEKLTAGLLLAVKRLLSTSPNYRLENMSVEELVELARAKG